MDEDSAEAREKARAGLKKVMSGKPGEQREGNELIEDAVNLDPDAVDAVRGEIRDRKSR
jgi:hypothetical protein